MLMFPIKYKIHLNNTLNMHKTEDSRRPEAWFFQVPAPNNDQKNCIDFWKVAKDEVFWYFSETKMRSSIIESFKC